ncbi:hypothetical protein QJQ45_002218 [Haematococcus lacustris]|nr:hypothetical protein QJQ45_002218 [Haematococcus lacustris]
MRQHCSAVAWDEYHGGSTCRNGAAVPAVCGPEIAPSLMDLPAVLQLDIAKRVAELGAGEAFARTCFAFLRVYLQLVPAFRLLLDGHRRAQLLTPRVVAALQARKCNLTLCLEQPIDGDTGQYIGLLALFLDRLGSCAAVKSFKIGSRIEPPACPSPLRPLDCPPDLAQRLLDTFPGITALSLHGYSITCTSLASLLSHQQLSLQLQQLDLTRTAILQPQQPAQPGAATLDSLFQGLRLQQLNLDAAVRTPLPDLRPLAQHLTSLHLTQPKYPRVTLAAFTSTLSPLTLIQHLTISNQTNMEDLPGLLQALPQLHTLQLPEARVSGQQQLQALLAATQLTSITLHTIEGLAAEARSSWQRLELTGRVDCTTVAYLPLHSLTQPLVLGQLVINAADDAHSLVSAAVRNLTQTCQAPVKLQVLELTRMGALEGAGEEAARGPGAAPEVPRMQQLVDLLQPLSQCCMEGVTLCGMQDVSAAAVAAVAALGQGCSRLELVECCLEPSLEFWQQLLCLMPSLGHVSIWYSKGVVTEAMCESLRSMAEQPWAQRLEVRIVTSSFLLPACCQAINSEFGCARQQPARFRAAFEH